MRFYITLPLILGAASASQARELLRSSGVLESAGITQIVSSKHAKARKVAETLMALKKSRDLQTEGDGEEGDGGFGFDFDFGGDGMDGIDLGDLDLGVLSLCDDEPMELGNVRCSCSLETIGEDSRPLTGIGDIIADFSNIMENGVSMGFDCNTVEPDCFENECGTMKVACDMTMDFNDMSNNSFNCDTCVQYTEPPEGSVGIMKNSELCMDMELCVPDLTAEKASDGLGFAMSDILCGCSATLDKTDCTCGVCGDISQGVKLECSGAKLVSTCTDTGFENLDASDAGSLASATSFMPQFKTTSDSAETSSASSPQAVAPFFVSALALAIVSSLA